MVDDSRAYPELRSTETSTFGKFGSVAKLAGVAIAFAAVVFLITEAMHYLLVPDLGRNAERLLSQGLSAAIAGCLAALLFRILRERHRADVARLQVIAEMNHHVRNALTPISLALDAGQDRDSVHLILEAVERIEWALREILPRQKPLPEPERSRLLYFRRGKAPAKAVPAQQTSGLEAAEGLSVEAQPESSQPVASSPSGTRATSTRDNARP